MRLPVVAPALAMGVVTISASVGGPAGSASHAPEVRLAAATTDSSLLALTLRRDDSAVNGVSRGADRAARVTTTAATLTTSVPTAAPTSPAGIAVPPAPAAAASVPTTRPSPPATSAPAPAPTSPGVDTTSYAAAGAAIGLGPAARRAYSAVRAAFGITSIGGYRAGGGDHGAGKAVDVMVYSNSPLGDAVAAYAIAHGRELGIKYLIWKQRIYDLDRPGWRAMADRGSITANHYDHVHISMR